MKKLEDIPKKKDLFNVPEGYFDNLPSVIQNRISTDAKAPQMSVRVMLAYVVPVLTFLIIGLIWYSKTSKDSQDVESMLAAIPTETIMEYLDESDLSTEEILTDVDFNANDLEEIESEVFEFPDNDVFEKEIEEELQTDSMKL